MRNWRHVCELARGVKKQLLVGFATLIDGMSALTSWRYTSDIITAQLTRVKLRRTSFFIPPTIPRVGSSCVYPTPYISQPETRTRNRPAICFSQNIADS